MGTDPDPNPDPAHSSGCHHAQCSRASIMNLSIILHTQNFNNTFQNNYIFSLSQAFLEKQYKLIKIHTNVQIAQVCIASY